MEHENEPPKFRRSRAHRWLGHLWREWTIESFRPIAPAPAKPNPREWDDTGVTAAWLGHSTVLINFFGATIITDPVLFPRIGIRIPFLLTIGPKRLTAPALRIDELPEIDLVLLSHAHFDHIDWRTLSYFPHSTQVITAPRTRDLLRWTRLRQITELKWGESKTITTSLGQKIEVLAVPVKHWGARMQRDDYRGYNGYLIESHGRRILFTGDTAFTRDFADLRHYGRLADPRSAGQLLQSSANASPMRAARRNWATQPVETTGCPPGEKRIDLAIFSIGAYDPWIRNHSTPEQAIQMANDAGAKYIMPVHHQTFRLSFEPFREPIGRFEAALRSAPDRIALREIGETFVLPL